MIKSDNGNVIIRGLKPLVYAEFINIIHSFYLNEHFNEEQILEAVRVAGLSLEELMAEDAETIEGDENVC